MWRYIEYKISDLGKGEENHEDRVLGDEKHVINEDSKTVRYNFKWKSLELGLY